MKPKMLLLSLIGVLILSAIVINAVSVVSAKPGSLPAMGTWIVSDEDAIEKMIPQHQLDEPTDDYALLQSDAVKISGYTRICHPYPGGQIGWTPEVRALTPLGWVVVPTESGWEPDEEGQYMACANVIPGTYAVFGYWEKPAGWTLFNPPPPAPTLTPVPGPTPSVLIQ
jgi:hypothetical protein